MEFRKNDILTLDIEDCGVDGEGIGKAVRRMPASGIIL